MPYVQRLAQGRIFSSILSDRNVGQQKIATARQTVVKIVTPVAIPVASRRTTGIDLSSLIAKKQ
jgi:hypothetical protein